MNPDGSVHTKEQCDENCKIEKYWYVFCPNKVQTYSGMDGERYFCPECGKDWFLDYDEMK